MRASLFSDAAGAAAHQQDVRLAALHRVDQLVELVQRQRAAVRAHRDASAPASQSACRGRRSASGWPSTSPVTNVVSKSWRTAFALSCTTAASRSWMLERVAIRKLSMSASPPMILSVAVSCVNVGVDSVQVSPTSKNAGRRRGVLAVVGEPVADDLDERQALQDGRVLDDRLDDAREQDVVGELGGLRQGKSHGLPPSGIRPSGEGAGLGRYFLLDENRTNVLIMARG